MKNVLALFLLLACTTVLAEIANHEALSPAEVSILEARKAIERKPTLYSGYNALATAFARRARETSDVGFYSQAEAALKKSFELAPGNLEGEKVRVWLLLGRHEFAMALDAAKAINQRVPDDVLVYGFLVDAYVELGNYEDAERSAQWMLNLRPGNLPALTRAAYLRELFGDVEGAYELMEMAFQSTPTTESEDRTWILTQMGHLCLNSGSLDKAEMLLHQALQIFPNYHYALGTLAKVRIEQKRYKEAVELLRQRYQAAPHAENLYDLAESLELAGQVSEAKKAFAEFEVTSLRESVKADNSNRELIFYYADHANQSAKALEIAQKEFARRQDIYTLDAYAWALHVNGQNGEARRQIVRALAVGTRDAKILHHAGEIALKLGDLGAAENYLKRSAELHAPDSEQAQAVLASLVAQERKN